MEGGERRLAGGGVLAGCLAETGRVGLDVEKVVGQLEGQPDCRAELAKPLAVRLADAGGDRAGLAGEADQRPGLHSLEADDPGFVGPVACCRQIERLAAGHAAEPRCPRQVTDDLQSRRGVEVGIGGDDVERIGQQGITCEDRSGFIKGPVYGRHAATQVVVVHGRQVVMDERVAMDAFERGGDTHDAFAFHAKKGGAFDDEEWPQALSAVEDGMAHGRQEALRPFDLAVARPVVEKIAKDGFNGVCPAAQEGVERDIGVAHRQGDGRNRGQGQGITEYLPGRPGRVPAPLRGSKSAGMTYASLGSSKILAGPTVDPEPRRRNGGRRRGRRRLLGGWVGRILGLLVLVAVLPLVLTLVYALPQVHPVSTLMAKDLVTFQGYERKWARLDDISPNLVNAVTMSEDGQFCSHRGIDWGELNAVIDSALAGESTRGASTIPMQTVKNLFLWHGRSFVRKVLEVPLAVYFDALLSKRRIMEIYLNIAEWGPGIYGAEAAARHHFGKSARDLSRREGALLAVTLPNPALRNPARPSQGMRRIASVVERRAQRAGGYVGCLG